MWERERESRVRKRPNRERVSSSSTMRHHVHFPSLPSSSFLFSVFVGWDWVEHAETKYDNREREQRERERVSDFPIVTLLRFVGLWLKFRWRPTSNHLSLRPSSLTQKQSAERDRERRGNVADEKQRWRKIGREQWVYHGKMR